MSAESPEPIADQLRNVPLPAGLTARLRSIADEPVEWTDDDIDFELASIQPPSGLNQRLRVQLDEIAQAEYLDEAIDAQLRDVEMPRTALARLRVMPSHRPRRKWLQAAVAASLIFILTGLHAWAAIAMLDGMRGKPREYVFVYAGPMHLAGDSQQEPAPVVYLPPDEQVEPQPFVPAYQMSEVELLADATELKPGAAGELFVSIENGLPLQDDVLLLRYGLLTSPYYEADVAPPLEDVALPSAAGMEPPLVRGYDRNFLVRNGVHPIVRPEIHKKLQQIQPPLWTATTTFDQAVEAMEAGRPVRSRDVRVEDFISAAAVGYPTKKTVSLHMDGGVAPLRPTGTRLLQITAQAGQVAQRAIPATHLVVVIDVSASMRWKGRLEMAKRAVAGLLPQLGPRDRLSVIAFNAEVMQVFELAQYGDGHRVQPMLEKLRPFGGANLAAAVQKATMLAISGATDTSAVEQGKPIAARVALITDSRDSLPDDVAAPLVSMLREASHSGFRLTAIDVGDLQTPALTLEDITQPTGSGVRHVASEREMRWALVETLTGGQSVVAPDATLQVQFNTAVVAGYRVLGHEATTLGGLMPGEQSLDLRGRDVAPVLVEVWLRNAGGGRYPAGRVASATMRYRDPATGDARTIRRSIKASEFAASFPQMSPQLQATSLAAHAAEALRGSPFTRPRDLRRVVEATRRVDEELKRSPAFMTFAKKLEKIAQQ